MIPKIIGGALVVLVTILGLFTGGKDPEESDLEDMEQIEYLKRWEEDRKK